MGNFSIRLQNTYTIYINDILTNLPNLLILKFFKL